MTTLDHFANKRVNNDKEDNIRVLLARGFFMTLMTTLDHFANKRVKDDVAPTHNINKEKLQ